jgi:hypothetical protein
MTMPRALKLLAKDRESGWTFTILLCVPYFAFLIWMHVHHEMWRDEVHAWILSRLAHGFSELVTGDRMYEGHPPLWFWYLHVWSWFTQSAFGVQAATIAAATTAAVLLARFAPFPRYLKILLLSSYYFGFEYTVMARNYVLGWLFLCLFCALYHPVRVRYFLLSISLALLSLTSFYGLVMCCFLLGYFILDQFRLSSARLRPSGPTELTASASPRIFTTVAVSAVAMIFCVLTIEPPEPNPFSPGFNFGSIKLSALPEMLFRITAGFLPWRHYSLHEFWGAPFTFWDTHSVWPIYVGSGLMLLVLVALYPSWRLMLIYLGAVVILLMFQQARFEGSPRHWGHFFMFFVAASWLLRARFPRRKHRFSTALLVCILAVQAESFAIATALDTREVFSGGRDAAAFIKKAGLQDLPIVAGQDYHAATVAGYLRRRFIASETDEVNETVVFHSRRRPFSRERLVNRAVEVSREKKSPVLLIFYDNLPDPGPGATSTLLFTSRQGIVQDEVFRVYLVQAF